MRRAAVWKAGLASVICAAVACAVVLLAPAHASTQSLLSFPTGQGWVDPAGSAQFNDWDFGLCDGAYLPNEAHLGADSQGTTAGQAVLAMSAGTVAQRLDPAQANNWPGGVLGIREIASDGTAFLAVYGHINPSVTVGAAVIRGQQIGTIFDQGPTNSHVHLGIYPLARGQDAASVTMRGESGCPPSTYGYVNPIPWLLANTIGFQNQIVQDGAGHSWMVDSTSHRKSIPDTRTYSCLRTLYHWVDNGAIDSSSLNAIPITPENQQCPLGDLNGDGYVDLSDLTLLLLNFGKAGYQAADINGDAVVNGADLSVLAADYKVHYP